MALILSMRVNYGPYTAQTVKESGLAKGMNFGPYTVE